MASPSRTPVREGARGVHPVVWTGLVLVVLQVAVRGVAASRGWFYVDDFLFLSQATDRPLSLAYLFAPHDSQLMPGGVLLTWIVAQAGAFTWSAVVAELVVGQLLASLACLWMLVRLFGHRWWVLVPLTFYLFSPMTLSGFMWWSAALNQLPCQLACFLLVTAHVEHLRTRRTGWAVLAVLALLLGLAFYVKTVLFLAPLFLLSLLYLTPAGPTRRARVTRLFRNSWPLWVAYAVVAMAYSTYYVIRVPDPTDVAGRVPYLSLLGHMIGIALPTLTLGGPWRWSDINAPAGLVDTPWWGVAVSWAVIGIALTALIRHRGADLRAFVVVLPYFAASALLVAQARARIVGGFVGLAPRYLADAAPLLVLGAALLWAGTLRAPGADSPLVPTGRKARISGVVGVVLVAGALFSSVTYVRLWDGPWAAKDYTRAVMGQARQSPILVADVPVPRPVLPAWSFPGNLPSRFFAPLGDHVEARTAGNDLGVINALGSVERAEVSTALETAPGPQPGCGYRVAAGEVQVVPLTGSSLDYFWWAQVSYLSGGRGDVRLRIGSVDRTIEVERGLHDYLVQGHGPITSVLVATASPDIVVCVDRVRAGELVPNRRAE